MFAKLLKHEWMSCRRVLRALNFTTLIAGILGAVVLRILFTEETMNAYASQQEWVMVLLPTALVFLFLGLMVSVFASEIYLLYRFYKSKFTDEGYLTFTLPASSRQIFLASFVHIALRTLIMSAVVIIALNIMFLGGMSGADVDFTEVFHSAKSVFSQIQAESHTYFAMSIVSGILSFVASTVITMTCVTVGSVLAKKHKLFAAIGLYYGYSMLYSVVSSMIMVSSMTASDTNSLLMIQMGIQTVAAVGGFFLSTFLMEKKLNLP